MPGEGSQLLAERRRVSQTYITATELTPLAVLERDGGLEMRKTGTAKLPGKGR